MSAAAPVRRSATGQPPSTNGGEARATEKIGLRTLIKRRGTDESHFTPYLATREAAFQCLLWIEGKGRLSDDDRRLAMILREVAQPALRCNAAAVRN
jgi:hypothetical protein